MSPYCVCGKPGDTDKLNYILALKYSIYRSDQRGKAKRGDTHPRKRHHREAQEQALSHTHQPFHVVTLAHPLGHLTHTQHSRHIPRGPDLCQGSDDGWSLWTGAAL